MDELFSNITWTKGQADDLDEEEVLSHWNHPDTNIYASLVIFIIMNVSVIFVQRESYCHNTVKICSISGNGLPPWFNGLSQ